MGNCYSNDRQTQLKYKKQIFSKPNKQSLIENLKQGLYKKISFLVGAGISVSSGIPDLRSPESGLYSQLNSLNIIEPTDIFNIEYFKADPKPFYIIAKKFINEDFQPTISHFFMLEIQKRNKLQLVCSQNIDGLELKAGIKSSKLIQAHGHYRKAHCVDCGQSNTIENFKKCVQNDTILLCSKCKGFVKPDIIFFGEILPNILDQSYNKIKQSDLIIIMGTSLQVYPFVKLLDFIEPRATIVIINKENPTEQIINQNRVVFYEGDIDENLKQIFTQLGWKQPNTIVKQPKILKQEDLNQKL